MSVCTLTESAKNKINTLCEEKSAYAVSLNMKGGGCAGFEYEWGFAEKDDIQADDEVIEAGTGRLVIGAPSIMFLIGTEIDYVSQIFGSNFEIRNPNAKSACGCGVSVNFDFDKLAEPAI
jgi:iron-sulfur cluster assembly protein